MYVWYGSPFFDAANLTTSFSFVNTGASPFSTAASTSRP